MDIITYSDVRVGVYLRVFVYVVVREGIFKNCFSVRGSF